MTFKNKYEPTKDNWFVGLSDLELDKIRIQLAERLFITTIQSNGGSLYASAEQDCWDAACRFVERAFGVT